MQKQDSADLSKSIDLFLTGRRLAEMAWHVAASRSLFSGFLYNVVIGNVSRDIIPPVYFRNFPSVTFIIINRFVIQIVNSFFLLWYTDSAKSIVSIVCSLMYCKHNVL